MELHKSVFYNNIPTYIRLINQSLSEEFKEEPLGKHIKVVGGYAFKSTQYQSTGIPVIRISDFQDEKIDLSTVKYYEESSELDKYELFEGDIIIAMTGGTIGKLGIVQKGLGKLYLNQRVGKFQVLNQKEFYDRYVYWIARGVQDKVKNLGYGGAQPNVSGKQIEALKFPIPPKDIQEKIVTFLRDLRDNKVNGNIYFNSKIESEILKLQKNGEKIYSIVNDAAKNETYISKLRQAILSEAIQGKLVPQNPNDEPASVLLEKIKAEKEKLIKEKKIRKEKPLQEITDEETPFQIPESWIWKRIGELFTTSSGGTPSRSNSEYWDGEIPWLKSGELDDNLSINKSEEKITEKGLKNSSAKIFEKGSVVLALYGATAGKLGILDFETTTNQAVCNFYKTNYITSKYLFYTLKSFRKKIIEDCFGGAQPNISQEYVNKMLFPLPPLNEQKRIVEKVNQLMKLCDELESQVKKNQTNSEKLMGAVLREAFENEA